MSKVDLNVFEAINCILDDCLDRETILQELFSDDKYYLYSTDLSQFGYKLIHGDFGGEGEGEYCYAVIAFEGKFYKGEYSYYSYNGCDFDGLANSIKEVVPKEVTKTVYV
tara:strand:+ start:14656 stop:14985 length:330 start_codon:yes stop_codon:yes gene_type:complete